MGTDIIREWSESIRWYEVPGRLLAGLVCRWFGHLPEMVGQEHHDGFFREHYRCTFCLRRGER